MKLKKLAWASLISLAVVIITAGIAGAVQGNKHGLRGARSWAFPANHPISCDKPAAECAQRDGLVKGLAPVKGFKSFALLESAAELLGLEPQELQKELQSGKSLAEIAQAKGIEQAALIEKIQAAITEDLDQAVADKKLSAETAAKIKENLTQRITDIVTKEHPPRVSVPRHRHTKSLTEQNGNA